MKRHFFTVFIAVCLVFSCKTITDVYVSKVGTEDLSEIGKMELRLLEYQFSLDEEILLSVREELGKMESRGEYNKAYLAKIYGLRALVEYYRGNTASVKKYLSQIQATNPGEEYYYILMSLLEEDVNKRIELLIQAGEKADSKDRINLYLAENYYLINDFRKATAMYDDALGALPEEFRDYYGKKREQAYHFIENPPRNIQSQDILTADKVNVGQVIGYILLETNLFDNFTVKKDINLEILLTKCRAAGYFENRALTLENLCDRKMTAYLVLHLLVRKKNDRTLLKKYRSRYVDSGLKSPIPDVGVNDYFFDAALILVEREIMELPDGIHFKPHAIVSGMELSEIVKSLMLQ